MVMESQQQANYPERHRFKISKITGVNVSGAVSEIPQDKARRLINFMPVQGEKIKKVPGYTTITLSTTLPANISRMYTCYVKISGTPTPHLIFFLANGSAYKHNISAGTTASIWTTSTFTRPRLVQWKQERILVVDPTAGLKTWDGASASNVDPSITGHFITVWEGRLIVVKQDTNTVIISVPDDYSDFNTANGAGAFIVNQPTLKGLISGVASTSKVLYIFGETAVISVSNLQSVGGVVTVSQLPLFGNRGCKYEDSIAVYENLVYTTDANGIWEINGYSVRRITDPDVDEWLKHLNNSTFNPVGFIGNLYNIDMFCLLVSITPPGMSSAEKWIWAFNNNGWFFMKFDVDITFMTDAFEIGGDQYNFGSNAAVVKNYFDTASETNVTSELVTRAETHGDDEVDKIAHRMSMTISDLVGTANISGKVLYGTKEWAFTLAPAFSNAITFVNDSAAALQFQNSTPADLDFITGGDTIRIGSRLNGRGKTIQLQLTETSALQYSIDKIIYEFFYGTRW